MQNMKAPDDLFSKLLTRLGMKSNILRPEQKNEVDGLVVALRDPRWSVRVAAVQALTKEQVPISSLVVMLLADEHESVRAAVARKLGELGEKVPVEPLIHSLDDPSWMVRADAAHALGKLGTRTPIEPLVKAMKDVDATVRTAAVQALGELGERAPIDALVSTLNDEEWLVREAVVLALGKMGEKAPVALLMEAVYDENETVRQAAKLTLQRTHPYGLPEIDNHR